MIDQIPETDQFHNFDSQQLQVADARQAEDQMALQELQDRHQLSPNDPNTGFHDQAVEGIPPTLAASSVPEQVYQEAEVL